MLTVIIGATGVGKSTLSKRISFTTGAHHISAGAWVREVTGCQDHGPKAAAYLGEESRKLLADDPTRAARWLSRMVTDCRRRHESIVVEGIRNPTDLVGLCVAGDRVIDLGGSGVCSWEVEGLASCRALRAYLEARGVLWQEAPRNLVWLSIPRHTTLDGEGLGISDGALRVRLMGLECYEGAGVTAVVRDEETGGTMHDVPLEYLSRAPRLPSGGPCYGVADRGSPVFEETPLLKCQIYQRDRSWYASGRSLGVLHWPQGNTLLHLVETDEGGLLLWPPHKLLFTDDATARLPRWTKNRKASAHTTSIETIDRILRAIDAMEDETAAETAYVLLEEALRMGIRCEELVSFVSGSCKGEAFAQAYRGVS